MFLQYAEIQNFRGIRRLKVDFESDTTVLIGENTWGKSSLLYALFLILGRSDGQLCSFSADDLYIPIRLKGDQDQSTSAPESSSLSSSAVSSLTPTAPTKGTEPSTAETLAPSQASVSVSSPPAPSQSTVPKHDYCPASQLLQKQGLGALADLEPLKVINTPNYQRRYYRVKRSDGSAALHIVDLPPASLTSSKEDKAKKRSKSYSSANEASEAKKAKAAASSTPSAASAATVPTEASEALALISSRPEDSLLSVQSGLRSELLKRAQQVLQDHEQETLKQDSIQKAQDDVAFYQRDVFTDKVERIVIDLVFCESDYGTLNRAERFAVLRPATYLGEDGLYRIHYRISASMQTNAEGKQEFVTHHELLHLTDPQNVNQQQVMQELLILNPLLRLRDRRMLKPHLDPQENAWQESGSGQLYTTAEQVQIAVDETASATLKEMNTPIDPLVDRANAAECGHGAGADVTSNLQLRVEEGDMQAISHFFTDIALDDDLTSSQIKDGISILNTIATKYLINYQSNNLSTAYNWGQMDGEPEQKRTARDIITHPVSLGSLRSLRASLNDHRPSRTKFLLSLLAGALLMSRGQREIDEYARPILVLEDIESRFHPTLLLNLWAILQLLPIQKIVTTNSSQLLSAVSMSKIRRLCKQYYDVRCYRIRDHSFSEEAARKISFHIRMNRANTLFARCWILVEGETEVWILNEIANILDLNLACSGVAVVEFAQCGLNPLIKLAQQLGIGYHVLTDGDDAGKHYAQIVRDFVGSQNAPEHLSVMPCVDIEHYLYSSGFADVYQKAAGLIIHEPKEQLPQVRSLDRAVRDTPPMPMAAVTNAANATLSGATTSGMVSHIDPEHVPTAAQTGEVSKAASDKDTEMVQANEHEQAHVSTKAKAADDAKAKAQVSKQPVPAKDHELSTVIKTVLHYNLGKQRDELLKVLETGHLHSKTQHEKVLPLEEVTRGDINNFYQYVRNLITHLPRSSSNLTKKQTRILNLLKQERVLWFAEINQTQQEQQIQQGKQSQQSAVASVASKAKPQETSKTCANKERLSKERPDLTMAESAESLERAVGTKQGSCNRGQQKACSGGDAKGQDFNDFYGALNAKELSQQGMSMSKVIDKALHKKTKPGMAILVSEALLQRGVESVPLAFVAMFAKVRRMAQSELPFT